ncbi:hypothetical protein [Kitasatospora sp. McL0602]|uniref:hypothetical protein n=1 Tax=Kitasatospora sp. McL0602 TaxID=3439530 RepID=UPI003F8BE9E6
MAASALLLGGLTACGSGGKGSAPGAAPVAPSGTATASGSAAGAAPATGTGAPAASSAGAAAPAGGTAQVAALAPKDALLAAAAVMEKAGSAQLTMSGVGAGANGTGVYSWKAPAAFELTMASGDGPGKLLVTADTMYIGVDEETAAGFGGKHWLRIDPKAVAAGQGKAAPGSEDAGSMATMLQTLNPAVQLAANAAAGKLGKVGTEQVGGADAVRFHSELPVEALVNAMPGLSDVLRKQVTDTLKKNNPSVSTDFWINGRGELVQQQSSNVGNGNKEPVTIGYGKLGSAGSVQAPAASDVMDFADMLKSGTDG